MTRSKQTVPSGDEGQAELARLYGHRRAKAIMHQREIARATELLAGEAQRTAGAKGVPAFAPTPERLARGKFEHQDITEHVYARDETGDRPEGRRVVMGRVYKDAETETRSRLKRRGLGLALVEAGVTFEADIVAAGLEPRMVANLLGAGGGRGDGPVNAVIDARDRVHYAVEALRLCGSETVRVVVAVVAEGATSAQASAARYSDEEKGRAHVAALLEVGLTMLGKHYALSGRHGPREAAKARAKARQMAKDRRDLPLMARSRRCRTTA